MNTDGSEGLSSDQEWDVVGVTMDMEKRTYTLFINSDSFSTEPITTPDLEVTNFVLYCYAGENGEAAHFDDLSLAATF